MLKFLDTISFPKFSGLNVNMMPIIVGDLDSLPGGCKNYNLLIKSSGIQIGEKVYLTIQETEVEKGQIQRRSGVHTDAICSSGWGGGGWGKSGIFIASNDGRCNVWQEETWGVDNHGSVKGYPKYEEATRLKPFGLYKISDRTPHEALPSEINGKRQFFRLVSNNIDIWWRKHSTPNPFGIQPDALILKGSKF